MESLKAMRGHGDVSIDFIWGTDERRNRARSWFWTRRKERAGGDPDDATSTEGSIWQYVHDNGNGGRELFVRGRISLAWEDPDGYAKGLMELLSE